MQPSWVTDEEFGQGYEVKHSSASLKSASGNVVNVAQAEPTGTRSNTAVSHGDSAKSSRDHIARPKPADGRLDKAESVSHTKSDQGHQKSKGSMISGSDAQSSIPSVIQSGASRSVENQKQMDEPASRGLDESMSRAVPKGSTETEVLSQLCFVLSLTFLVTWYSQCQHFDLMQVLDKEDCLPSK